MVVSDLTEDFFWIMKVDHFGKIWLSTSGFSIILCSTHKAIIKTKWDIANKSYGYSFYQSLIPPCCYICLKCNFGKTHSLSLTHLCQPLSDVHVTDYVCRAGSAVWFLIQHGIHYGFQAVTVVCRKRGSLSR